MSLYLLNEELDEGISVCFLPQGPFPHEVDAGYQDWAGFVTLDLAGQQKHCCLKANVHLI